MVRKKGLGRGLVALLSATETGNLETNSDTSKMEERKAIDKVPSRKKDQNKKKEAINEINLNKNSKIDSDALSDRTEGAAKQEQQTDEDISAIQRLSLDRLHPNPDQPRKYFEEGALFDLATSIREHGVIQPIIVRRHPDIKGGYIIVAGERRYRAAQMAGLKEVPVVRNDANSDTAILSVIENIQREDLSPLEEAQAYAELMEERGMTQQQLAEILGKSRAYIANIVRLRNLDDSSLEALQKGLLTSSQARVLLSESDLKKRESLRHLFIEGKTNVNAAEKRTSKAKTKRRDPFLSDLEQRFCEALGTKVTIRKVQKGWDISISCYQEEDLEHLIARLGGDIDA